MADPPSPGPILPRASATPEATKTIELLRARHGSIVFHQSGGCCSGSCPMCLRADELPPGPNDIELGEVAGAPVLIDRDLYKRWGSPEFRIDVAAGAGDNFSLEGSDGLHFVNVSGDPD